MITRRSLSPVLLLGTVLLGFMGWSQQGCPQQGDREGIAMLPGALQPSQNSLVWGLILHSYSFDI